MPANPLLSTLGNATMDTDWHAKDTVIIRFFMQTTLKVDMPILTCIFFTFNWLTLTSEMHLVKLHPEVASCLLSRGKRKYAPLGMRLSWKYIRNYFLVYHLISHFLLYLQNYKKFEAEILDLQTEKYGLSFDIKKYTTSGWTLGDENVIGIRAFKKCKPELKGSHLGTLCPYAIVYCYLEFKLRYLKNLKLFSIRVKELFEPIVLRKKGDGFMLF